MEQQGETAGQGGRLREDSGSSQRATHEAPPFLTEATTPGEGLVTAGWRAAPQQPEAEETFTLSLPLNLVH